MQLLREPVGQPIDSQHKIPRNFLESSEIRHETMRLKPSHSSPHRTRPADKDLAHSTRQSRAKCSPTLRSAKLPCPNQHILKHRGTSTGESTPRTGRSSRSQIQDSSNLCAFTPLLPQSCKDSAKTRPSRLNKSRVLKNDACSASLAATENPAAPDRDASTPSNPRGRKPQGFSPLQANQTAYNTSPMHKDSRFTRL